MRPADPADHARRIAYRDSLPHAVRVRKLVILCQSRRERRALAWNQDHPSPRGRIHKDHRPRRNPT